MSRSVALRFFDPFLESASVNTVSEQIRRAVTAYLEKNSGRQRFAG